VSAEVRPHLKSSFGLSRTVVRNIFWKIGQTWMGKGYIRRRPRECGDPWGYRKWRGIFQGAGFDIFIVPPPGL
jgi:hypothetical protein